MNDEWADKVTEFTEAEFFERMEQLVSDYELETHRKDDMLIGECLTEIQSVSHYNLEGKLETKRVCLNYTFEARYDKKSCHICAWISGHGEDYGASHPVKTYDDLKEASVPYADKLKKRAGDYGRQGNLFEDLNLFGL